MPITPTVVFCSYSHVDLDIKNRLFKELQPLVEKGEIVLRHDEEIPGGRDLHPAILSEIRESDVILLLVSPDFLASDYCMNKEVVEALDRRQHHGASVIPIICRPCDWQNHFDLRKIKALPDNGKPITRWGNRDEAYLSINRGIQLSIKNSGSQGSPDSKDGQVAIEREFKFLSDANTQFKFSLTIPAQEIFETLSSICSLANIKIDSRNKDKIVDEYYDDEASSLQKSGCSFRRRTRGAEHLVTFKRKQNQHGGALQRFEHELPCTDQVFIMLAEQPDHFRSMFSKVLNKNSQFPTSRLHKIVTIENTRESVKLTTQSGRYSFCFDQFHFFDENTGLYSERFSEIEIEVNQMSATEDPDLDELLKNIETFFLHSPDNKTKMQRGMEWLTAKDRNDEFVVALSIDIMGFNELSPAYQKNALQYINHKTRVYLTANIKNSEGQPLSFSLGDGMVFLFSDYAHVIPDLLNILQESLREERHAQTASFGIRSGIASGNAFKFTDANGGFSYGGRAIHDAKTVMALGDKWHILTTPATLDFIYPKQQMRDSFTQRSYRLPNGENCEVMNLHVHGSHLGNPADPLAR